MVLFAFGRFVFHYILTAENKSQLVFLPGGTVLLLSCVEHGSIHFNVENRCLTLSAELTGFQVFQSLISSAAVIFINDLADIIRYIADLIVTDINLPVLPVCLLEFFIRMRIDCPSCYVKHHGDCDLERKIINAQRNIKRGYGTDTETFLQKFSAL